MFERLKRAAATIRPKAVAQLAARVTRLVSEHDTLAARVRDQALACADQLTALITQVEGQRDDVSAWHARLDARSDKISDLSTKIGQIQATLGTLTSSIEALGGQLTTVAQRCDQLSVASERLGTDEDLAPVIARVMDTASVRAHVAAALDRSPLVLAPFPHVVIDDVLPRRLYSALIDTMPPRVLFEDNPVNKQQLRVPPRLAGSAAFRLWRFLVADVVEGQLQQAIVDKFREPLTEFAGRFWPSLSLDEVRFKGSDGRIILRRRGYVIPPHRDPKWGWLTFILYLAKPGDPDTWGTQLYRVNDDVEAPGAQPFWMQAHDNVLAADVRFLPNRALVFLNSDGSHGASLPQEAPADFERYIYQCRIGPDRATIDLLKARLTPEARAKWEGKQGY